MITDYYQKKYPNPFFKKKRKKFKINFKINWRLMVAVILILIIIGALGWTLLFSKLFEVKQVNINGIGRIGESEIENMVWQETANKRFKLFSETNINTFNAGRLANDLKAKYYFESLIIKKRWLHTIDIAYKEKDYSLIWNDGGQGYYIDFDGNIISSVNPNDSNLSLYPTIYNTIENKIIDRHVNQDPRYFSFAAELFKKIGVDQNNFQVNHFFVDNDAATLKVKTTVASSSGPDLYFNINNTIDQQLADLKTLIDNKLKKDFITKKYLDLRFQGRVYYQ